MFLTYIIIGSIGISAGILQYVYPALQEHYQELCQTLVDNVKLYMPELLHKQKVHLILHLVESMALFGPSSAFSAER